MNKKTARSQGCKVLLVDDNEDIAALIEAHLNDPHIDVTVATGGREGIQAFKEGCFDLVLMDLEMPEMNGADATRAMRFWERQKGLSPTPIAALTAASSAADVSELFGAGCDLYLAKPITRNMLLQTVGQYFAAGRGSLAYAAIAA